ncbi:MAG: COQ9 family protein [Rhodospirillales bacterium]|nr:COQ9 family protein [Rhodospirillales bacterium]
MTDERRATRDRILLATLPHVAFDGWTRKALTVGVADAGLSPDMALRAFPDGIPELVDHFADWADRRMLAELERRGAAAMRIRDRVTTGVRARLEVLAAHREAVRRLLAFLALPPNAPLAARLLWRTVDAMWYAAGDNATDFNYYTKRGLLAAVYTTTVLCWLADSSEEFADTWAFLDRRIADVMKVPTYKARLKEALGRLPRPSRLLRRAR